MDVMRLPFPLLLALRYLRSTRKDAFVSFLSAVAAGGVALGVAALILSLAALSGFQEVLISQVLAATPEIEVLLPSGADPEAARRRVLETPGVRGAQVTVRGQGWVVVRGSGVQPVELVGFGGRLPASFGTAAGSPEGLYLSSELAHRWGVEMGDALEVVSPRPTLAPFGGPQPRLRGLTVAGLFEGGGAPGERQRVALPLAAAVSLLAPVEHRLEIDAGGFARAPAVAARLARRLPPGSRVATWQELERPLFFVLRLEKGLMFSAVFLIVLVAALALVADLSLIIANKRPEIGMLGTLGASREKLVQAFLLLGASLAALGAALGALLGVGGAWLLDHYRLLPVPRGIYFLDHIPFVVRGGDLAVVLGATLLLAVLSSLYGARRAAALTPVEALRR